MVSFVNSIHHSVLLMLKLTILFLILTLVIATVTLIERKVLALIQRRVGPNYIGYKGRLQFIADALKLLIKHILIVNKTNRALFIIIPAFVLIVSYLFWANLIWSPNLAICEIEYNLIFMGILSCMFSLLTTFAGFASKNKYAAFSATRVVVINFTLELLMAFFILSSCLISENLSFLQLASLQTAKYWHLFIFLPVLPIIILTFLIEIGRIPFDLTEAESELIAGYTTEYGGFYFALFYLAEYFHLFCFSVVYVICLTGGWY